MPKYLMTARHLFQVDDAPCWAAAAAPPNPRSAAVPCGRSKVIAPDAATVVETTSGMIRGFEVNGPDYGGHVS
jgi:hypothetical protein